LHTKVEEIEIMEEKGVHAVVEHQSFVESPTPLPEPHVIEEVDSPGALDMSLVSKSEVIYIC
jgi:hypothetical protein